MTMFEILQINQYDSVPTNVEHPMPLSLSNKMRLEEEQQNNPMTFAQVQEGPITQALKDLQMQSKTIKAKYTGYIRDYYGFIKNEREAHGPTNKQTLVNFFSYLKNQQFFAPKTLWCVYSTLNYHYQQITGKKMQNLMVLSTLMSNTEKNTSRTKQTPSLRDNYMCS